MFFGSLEKKEVRDGLFTKKWRRQEKQEKKTEGLHVLRGEN